MIDSLFQALASGLSLWESKESRKYLDRLLKLEKDYYEEFNKEVFDDAVLDNIRHQLCALSKAFTTKVGTKNS